MLRWTLILGLELCLVLCPVMRAAGDDRSSSVAPLNASQVHDAESQAHRIPRGTVVEIRLQNGEKIRGRMVKSAENHFVVRWVNGKEIEDRTIALGDVKSIKVLDGKPSRAKTIGRYLIVGALGGAAGVVELAKEKP